MDKLEQYLDQVCRGIAGPRSLRQHIRQELREHLLDAVAGHKAAGLSEDHAIERALEDFGGPEQVRAELEATHGHRLLGVVIDKAMQWKELTMKSKWLWTTWAHLMLLGVIAAEIVLLAGIVVFIVPKQMYFYQEGLIGSDIQGVHGILMWGISFVAGLGGCANNWIWFAGPVALAWGLFEWRVRSEHKPFMRLSAMGTLALGLMAVVGLTAAALLLPLMLTLQEVQRRIPEPAVNLQAGTVDDSLKAMEQALAKNDWDGVYQHAVHARSAMDRLGWMGAAAPVLVAAKDQPRVDEVRKQLKLSREYLHQASVAAMNKDAAGMKAAMEKFQAAYAPVRATTRPVK
jgi:hypothetical protein